MTKEEIEFVCANPNFPDTPSRDDLFKLYRTLKQWPGVHPYMQDWSYLEGGHLSLAVILTDTDLGLRNVTKKEVIKLAKKQGIDVDVIQEISDKHAFEAEYELLEAQIKPKILRGVYGDRHPHCPYCLYSLTDPEYCDVCERPVSDLDVRWMSGKNARELRRFRKGWNVKPKSSHVQVKPHTRLGRRVSGHRRRWPRK